MVVGPGWSLNQASEMKRLLPSPWPMVIDADGLNMIALSSSLQAQLRERTATTILTPHPGEAARLLNISVNSIQENRLHSALSIARLYNTFVVLKGAQTLIVTPDLNVWVNPFGSANLAVAGTGDVLAGMIGGLLVNSSSVSDEMKILAAVSLHGLVGEQDGWHKAGQLEALIAKKSNVLRQRLL